MTHEATVKIAGVKTRFSFCTQAYYNLTVKYNCTLAEVFQRAQNNWLEYYRDILFEAASVCPENNVEKLPANVFDWLDTIDIKDADIIRKAHDNARILGKPISGRD